MGGNDHLCIDDCLSLKIVSIAMILLIFVLIAYTLYAFYTLHELYHTNQPYVLRALEIAVAVGWILLLITLLVLNRY